MDKINFKNLPDTTTPVNAQNLNLLQTNVEDEMPRAGTRSASSNWNDLLTEGRKYSIETINGKTSGGTLGEGAPPNAYDYGTLISLNPRKTTSSGYDQTQIYIEDGVNMSSRNGVWIRKRAEGTWTKLIRDVDMQPVNRTNEITVSSGYTRSGGSIYTTGKICTVNMHITANSDTQNLVHNAIIATGFPQPSSEAIIMGIPITENLSGELKLCRFLLDSNGQLKVYYPVGGYFSASGKPRYFNFSYVTQ